MATSAATPSRIKGTSITTPTASVDNHTLVLGQLKETTEIAQRLRGDPNDSFVRVGELNSALGVRLVNGTLQPNNVSITSVVSVSVINSIMGAGTAASPLQLVGDSAAPGNNMVYGTNGSGVKGWYASGGGGGSLTVKDGTTTVTGTTQITFSGAVVSGATPNAVVTITATAAKVPTTIPSLVYWFDASTNAVTGAGGQIPVIGSPDPVRLPMIASGVSGGASNIGNTLNSLPVLTVGSTGIPTGAYLLSTPAFNLGAASTVFVVSKPGTSFAGSPVFSSGGVSSLAFFINAAGKLSLNSAAVSGIATSTGALSLGVAVQVNYTYTDTTGAWAFRIARAADSSGTAGALSVNSPVTTLFDYGGGGGGQPFIGDVAELIAYTRVLSGAEIASIEAYLLAKWGV